MGPGGEGADQRSGRAVEADHLVAEFATDVEVTVRPEDQAEGGIQTASKGEGADQRSSRAVVANHLVGVADYLRGCAYNYEGQYDKAVTDLTEAIRLNPDWAWSYVYRAFAYQRLGKATEDLTKPKQLHIAAGC